MFRRKIKIGITGGIGSGKSYVCRLLETRGIPVFSCDDTARLEMTANESLRSELRRLVSPHVYCSDGSLNKPVVRGFLQSSPDNAARLDEVVHPYVRKRWQEWAAAQDSEIVAMECALLFEAQFDNEVDSIVLVSAACDVRVSRVMKRDGVDAETVKRWMEMQMPEEEKRERADFIILNDGTQDLERQIDNVLNEILHR